MLFENVFASMCMFPQVVRDASAVVRRERMLASTRALFLVKVFWVIVKTEV